ncbi:development-specific protein LVN1.2-like [Patiria miniata]|uniref:Uncharacterized protein n=1 Tax=Patiria miniata TaxID=46514 RepID=A0A914B006_PATMI|nr:development-specific protein LVN1.2-like [Patiria miniata]
MGVQSVVCLLLVVAATTYAQKPCCYPDQFEISEGRQVGMDRAGKGSAIYETCKLAFDYTNKRIAKIGDRIEDGRTMDFQVIYDFKDGAEYRLEPKMQRCEKLRLAGPISHCVPENATFGQSMYLGDNKLTIDVFYVAYKTERGAGQGSLSVTQGDCLPSSFLTSGVEGDVSYMELAGYFNYVSGIKNPSEYFTVPDYCPTMFSNGKEPTMFDTLPDMMLV